jgi:hypothetical protein
MTGSAPTFVTEDSDKGDAAEGDGADDDAEEEEQVEVHEEVRGGLGSSGRAGIGGGKQQQQQQQPKQQQAGAHQPITSNAAFAASLYQV